MADAKSGGKSAEVAVNLYEGMFLLPQGATSDLAGALDVVRGMLNRAEAEILVLRKWDERRLAYPIENQKRGLYILTYFRARATQIANIERDCNLSEQVLRVLMLKAEWMGDAELEAARTAVSGEAEARVRGDRDREPQQAGAY